MVALGAVVGVVLCAVGLVTGVSGYRRYDRGSSIAETPTTDVRRISNPGTVELVGEVVPAEDGDDVDGDGTFESYVTGRNCVLTAWEIYDWSERGDHSRWKNVAEGYESEPFYLDDGTGRVLVDPGSDGTRETDFLPYVQDLGDFPESVSVGDVVLDFDRLTERLQPVDEEPPARLRALEGRPSVPRQSGSITNLIDVGNAHGDRRYEEGMIKPGEEVYLLGTATDRTDEGRRRLRPKECIVRPSQDTDTPFVLSKRSEDRLLSDARWGRVLLGVAGLSVALGVSLFCVSTVGL